MSPGAVVDLGALDLDRMRMVRDGQDLVLDFGASGRIVLAGFFVALESEDPPVVQVDDVTVPIGQILASVEQAEPAAGFDEARIIPDDLLGGGANFTPTSAGRLGDDIDVTPLPQEIGLSVVPPSPELLAVDEEDEFLPPEPPEPPPFEALVTISDGAPTSAEPAPPPPSSGEVSGQVAFTVALSSPLAETVTVEYQAVPEPTTSGLDFGTDSGTVTFMPGEVSKDIMIDVYAERTDGPPRDFTVQLTRLESPARTAIADGIGVGRVGDEGPVPVEPTVSPDPSGPPPWAGGPSGRPGSGDGLDGLADQLLDTADTIDLGPLLGDGSVGPPPLDLGGNTLVVGSPGPADRPAGIGRGASAAADGLYDDGGAAAATVTQ